VRDEHAESEGERETGREVHKYTGIRTEREREIDRERDRDRE
jgi:hypothetical protein